MLLYVSIFSDIFFIFQLKMKTAQKRKKIQFCPSSSCGRLCIKLTRSKWNAILYWPTRWYTDMESKAMYLIRTLQHEQLKSISETIDLASSSKINYRLRRSFHSLSTPPTLLFVLFVLCFLFHFLLPLSYLSLQVFFLLLLYHPNVLVIWKLQVCADICGFRQLSFILIESPSVHSYASHFISS